MKEEKKSEEFVFGNECNYCGGEEDLKEDPVAPGLLVCKDCRERFALQEEMIRLGLEIQPEIE
jgi:hypothetical protein